MKEIKKSKDGKYRLGRKQVIQLAGPNNLNIWAYKTSGMLVVAKLPYNHEYMKEDKFKEVVDFLNSREKVIKEQNYPREMAYEDLKSTIRLLEK